MTLSDSDLNTLLLAALPELREEFVSIAGSDDPASETAGITFGSALGPWLADRTLLAQDTPLRTDDRLRRAFELIERLAEEPPDSLAGSILRYDIFHWLFWGPDQLILIPKYVPLMGPETLVVARAMSPNRDFSRALSAGAA